MAGALRLGAVVVCVALAMTALPARAQTREVLAGRWSIQLGPEWRRGPDGETQGSPLAVVFVRDEVPLELRLEQTLERGPITDKALRARAAATHLDDGELHMEDAPVGGRWLRVRATEAHAERWLAAIPHPDGYVLWLRFAVIPDLPGYLTEAQAILGSIRSLDAPLPCVAADGAPAPGVRVRARSGWRLMTCAAPGTVRMLSPRAGVEVVVRAERWPADPNAPLERGPPRRVPGKQPLERLTLAREVRCGSERLRVEWDVAAPYGEAAEALAQARAAVQLTCGGDDVPTRLGGCAR